VQIYTANSPAIARQWSTLSCSRRATAAASRHGSRTARLRSGIARLRPAYGSCLRPGAASARVSSLQLADAAPGHKRAIAAGIARQQRTASAPEAQATAATNAATPTAMVDRVAVATPAATIPTAATPASVAAPATT